MKQIVDINIQKYVIVLFSEWLKHTKILAIFKSRIKVLNNYTLEKICMIVYQWKKYVICLRL